MTEELINDQPDQPQVKTEIADGKWYLVWDYRDPYVRLDECEQKGKVELKARTREEAQQEADLFLTRFREDQIDFWEYQKATYEHPPKSAFQNGPFNPRVICEAIDKVLNDEG